MASSNPSSGSRGAAPTPGSPCRICDMVRDMFAAASAASHKASSSSDTLSSGSNVAAVGMHPGGAATAAGGSGGDGSEGNGSGAGMRRADCLGCRLTGLMAGLGCAGYLSTRLLEEPRPRGAHRVTLVVASAALAGLGIARGAGWY